MHEDLDTGLGRIADRAGGAVRLRPAAQIRARGDRRRTRHRVGTAALSVGALGLAATGVASLVANGGLGGGDGSPVATQPPTGGPTTVAPSITEDMLLTAADLNRVGPGWQQTDTNRTDDGTFLRCQRDTLASLGATEVLVRTFQRPASGGQVADAGQLIAYFPSSQAAQDANGTLFDWVQTCGDYATGTGGKLAKVGGDIVADTVQRRGPVGPGNGAAWQLMFDDDDRTDEYAWFDSIGIGFMDQPFLTIVTYDDYGQDANYEPLDQMPGVVLLQDAYEKLPS